MVLGCFGRSQGNVKQFKVSDRKELTRCNNHPKDIDIQNCYSIVADENKDISLCDEILASNIRKLCVVKVVKKTRNETACRQIMGDKWRYDQCVDIARGDRIR